MCCDVKKIGGHCAEGLALFIQKAIHPFQKGPMSICLSKHKLCPAAEGFLVFILGCGDLQSSGKSWAERVWVQGICHYLWLWFSFHGEDAVWQPRSQIHSLES